MTLKDSWLKFLSDASSTRIQITYAVVGTYVALMVKGIIISTTVPDVVAVLNAAWPGVGLVLLNYFGGRVLEARNGKEPTNGASQ